MTRLFDLYLEIDNYMKFMSFVKTSSPLTLRAYWLDLRQAFTIPSEALAPHWGPGKAQSFQAEGPAFVAEGPRWTEGELLDHARRAFDGWTSLSLSSRNRKAATLKSFLSWAHAERKTEADLSERITCPKVPHRLPHYLSVDEITALLESFKGEDGAAVLRERVLILLLYGGGLRVSEACRLRWVDFDVDRRLLRVLGKGSKERLVPLPVVVAEILLRLREVTSGNYVFGDGPLSPRAAYEWVRSRGGKAGLHHRLHPHALRHSYATHLLGGGANLRTLQELLGHESLRATEKYTHLGIDQLARTLENHHPLGEKKRRSS